jgi:RHS repeat-associated protein
VYENDTLRFINHEEGRVIPQGNEYQYHLKDHLGNVRVTFTSKDEVETAKATMEAAQEAQEQGKFLNYDEAIKINSAIFDRTHRTPEGATNVTFYSTRLTGANTNAVHGLAKSISVMPGDKIDVEVFAKYLDPNSSNWTQALANFMASIAAGGGAPAGTIIDGGAPGSLGGGVFPHPGYLAHSGESGTGPKAYLNYLVFGRDYVYKTGGFRRLSGASREYGQNSDHERLAFDGAEAITIKEAGYVYIWLSNENETPVEVYFDDLKVTHTKSPVVASDDYYPFGLTFNSYNRENTTPNQYKFSGKEIQDELSLNWYDFGNRMYNSEIGRWNRIDDFSDKYHPVSPYNYALNNPLKYVDPTGDSVIRVNINDRSGYIHGATTVYIDHTIFDDLIGILNAAVTTGTHIKINSSFRTNKKQAELKESKDAITPASPGNSPHNAGVGIDFSLYENNDVSQGRIKSNSTVTSDNAFIKAVKGFDGWRWGGDFSTPDKVHIDRRPGETEFAKIRDANQSQMHGDDELGNLDKYVTRVENVAVGITKYQRWLNNPRDRNAAREALDELRQEFSAIKGNLQQLKQQIKQASGNK